jgi:hypothetical protein
MKLADGTVAEVGMEVTRVDGTPDGYWSYYLGLGRIAEIYPRSETCYVDFILVGGEDGRDYECAKKEAMNSFKVCDAKYLVSAVTQGYADFDEQVFLRLLE